MKLQTVFISITLLVTASIVTGQPAPENKQSIVYNVVTYGAGQWDTIPDDSAIQAAVDDAVANYGGAGAIIYFPRGDYILENPIFLGDGVNYVPNTNHLSFEGETKWGTRLRVDGASGFVLRGGDLSDPGSDNWYRNATLRNSIKNLMLFKNNNVPGDAAIDVLHCGTATIENVAIIAEDLASFSHGIRAGMDYLTVKNCHIKTIDWGKGTIERGITIESGASHPTDGVRIEYTAIFDCNIGIYANGQTVNVIENNTLGACRETGIYVFTDTVFCNAGLTIRNNQIEGCGATSWQDTAGFWHHGNLIHNQIWMKNAGFLAKGVIIEGNFFNLEGLKDINGDTLQSPYDISDPLQLAQCTFNRNVYRVGDGVNGIVATQISEGLTVGSLPVASATAISPMLGVGGDAAVTGMMGIGTVIPLTPLHVNLPDASSFCVYQDGTTPVARLTSTTGANPILQFGTNNGAQSANIGFNGTAVNVSRHLTTTEFLGVGTTTPLTPLHVNLANSYFNIYQDGGSPIARLTSATAANPILQFGTNNGAQSANINFTGTAVNVSRNLTTTEFLGVGTLEPLTPLHVNLDDGHFCLYQDATTPVARLTSTTAANPTLQFGKNNGAEAANIVYTGSSILVGSNLTTTGSVGIGITEPSEKLQVDGAIRANDYKSQDGSVGVSANVPYRKANGTNGTLVIKNGLIISY